LSIWSSRPADESSMRTDSWEWLVEKRHRRASLRAVETELRAGRLAELPAEELAGLMDVLARLLKAEDLGERETIRIARIMALLLEAHQQAELSALKSRLQPTPPLPPQNATKTGPRPGAELPTPSKSAQALYVDTES
jgi:hypothetical protein